MAFKVSYTRLEKTLHRIAFASPSVQKAMADIEDTAFGSSYRDVAAGKPIFITSLPRAGTTLLLELMSELPGVATHTYRDMPFVLSPVLWARLTGGFQKKASLRERAHGDGVKIGFESPEAFEEVFWHAFWPKHYRSNGIRLWSAGDATADAKSFFIDHMKKIVFLRCQDQGQSGRYVAKNNGNIARIPLLRSMLPNSIVLVPVRDPFRHAFSMHRQHSNFLEMHRSDPFVRKYMRDIGHFEFGQLHRPIQFPELEALTAGRDPMQLDYWLAYWIAAFRHLLSQREEILFVSYEGLCAGGETALARLFERLELDAGDRLAPLAQRLRPPGAESDLPEEPFSDLVNSARETYDAVLAAVPPD